MALFASRRASKGGSEPSLLAVGCEFRGDLRTSGPLLVNGIVRGNGVIGGALTIGKGAEWHGDIQAPGAGIDGTVIGNLTIAGSFKASASARIRGNITARAAAIATGAIVDGEVRVTDATAAAGRRSALTARP